MTDNHPSPLSAGDAHVWRVDLNQNPERLAELRLLLSPDELARAARFAFARDRDRFAACRGALRALLSGYLARPAAEIRFAYGLQGKPAVAPANDAAPCPLRFNVSHADDTALIAVTWNREVGVDIERVTGDRDREAVARSVFSVPERAYIKAQTPDKQREAFFVIWTLKEAYLKAVGTGLTEDPRTFTVTPGADKRRAALWASDGSPIPHWFLLQQLNVAENGPYAAALAVAGDDVSVSDFTFA